MKRLTETELEVEQMVSAMKLYHLLKKSVVPFFPNDLSKEHNKTAELFKTLHKLDIIDIFRSESSHE